MHTFGKYRHTPANRFQDRITAGSGYIRTMMMTNACTTLALLAATLLIVIGIVSQILSGRMVIARMRSGVHVKAGCQQSKYNTKKDKHLTHRRAS